jgi:hypothetical protein
MSIEARTASAVLLAFVCVIVFAVTRSIARSIQSRWRRRSWCIVAFGVGGALFGGAGILIENARPESVLTASLFCAVLGALAGNVVRLVSRPDRTVREELGR